MTKKQALSRANTIKRHLEKERDALNDLINELDELRENCEEAIIHLEDATDVMSRTL